MVQAQLGDHFGQRQTTSISQFEKAAYYQTVYFFGASLVQRIMLPMTRRVQLRIAYQRRVHSSGRPQSTTQQLLLMHARHNHEQSKL